MLFWFSRRLRYVAIVRGRASKEIGACESDDGEELEAEVPASDWKDETVTNGGGARSIIFLKEVSDGL
jgi:hypothetical protein